MQRMLTALVVIMALALFAPSAARAAGNAGVYIVHGIPGADLGLDPALPVDISVNGACAITGFTFGTITDRVALPAGSYDIAISLSDGACGGPVAISAPGVQLAGGQSYAIVAHLTEGGAPTAGVFPFSPVSRPGTARVVAHHTAAAPIVDITVARPGGAQAATLQDVPNGASAAVDFRPGSWGVAIAPGTGGAPVFEAALNLKPKSTYLVFAVGSLGTGSFTVLLKAI
ncbi:MAG TPA: DUF4397 domain-containing protein [Chloroflexaceae bacterium]|nr:DUF4397 domain-containing protein [Chloroflexaceae bacterium]